jgi:hypothetical protein
VRAVSRMSTEIDLPEPRLEIMTSTGPNSGLAVSAESRKAGIAVVPRAEGGPLRA